MSQMPLFEQKILDLVWILNQRPRKQEQALYPSVYIYLP